MTGLKPLPIGIDNFSKLRSEGYYYTDKSMMALGVATSRSKRDNPEH